MDRFRFGERRTGLSPVPARVLAGQRIAFAARMPALTSNLSRAFYGFAVRTAKAVALRSETATDGVTTLVLIGHGVLW